MQTDFKNIRSIGDFKSCWHALVDVPNVTGAQTEVTAIAESTFTQAQDIFGREQNAEARTGQLLVIMGHGLVEVSKLKAA